MQSPSNKNTRAGSAKSLVTVAILLAWLAGLSLALLNRQAIIDWWKLRDYQASAAVSSLANQATLTDYGRKIFYVNHPSINNKTRFFKQCPNGDREHSIVLGCYHGNQGGIFLLDVTDPRLEGVEQVTAAHEMLHGAYDRLSQDERRSVNAQLENFYKKQLKDPRILKTIEAYKSSEPKDVINEMHSIFATEISDLPESLEKYYSRYFDNRKQVASFAAQYQAEFTSRQDAIDRYDQQLDNLKTQINKLEAGLKSAEENIVAEREALVRKRESGDVAEYNAGVPAYNGLITSYNAQAEQLRGLLVQYNQLVASRNEIAQEADQLVKNLSSDVEPIDN